MSVKVIPQSAYNEQAIQQQVLSYFADNIPQFVFWKDRNSVFLGCNDNIANYAGLACKSQIKGKTDYDLPWSKEESDFYRKVDQEVMSSGKTLIDFEEQITLANGNKKWLKTSKAPLYNDAGEIIGVIGWYLDITTCKTIELRIDENSKALFDYNLRLEAANKKLEIANIDLEKFTSAASHDLKTPIRTMVNFAQLIKRRKKELLDSETIEYLEYIIKSANRMNALVEDILTYAKTGAKNTKSELVNLSELVEYKLLDLKEIISLRAANINLDLPTHSIKCHPHLIGLVFYNLTHNAIKFNTSDTPEVSLSYSEANDFWIFTVVDNGIGIAPEFIKKSFEPFKRLVGNEYEGSGIGLSICKRVVNIHKGDISVEENPTGGSIFKFTISKHI